jgi:hypothetical protein
MQMLTFKNRAKALNRILFFGGEFQVLKVFTPKHAVGAVNAWNAIRALAF